MVVIMFESSVIPSGSKTRLVRQPHRDMFESSVIPSGSKTLRLCCSLLP